MLKYGTPKPRIDRHLTKNNQLLQGSMQAARLADSFDLGLGFRVFDLGFMIRVFDLGLGIRAFDLGFRISETPNPKP